jgi:hypothetical protein
MIERRTTGILLMNANEQMPRSEQNSFIEGTVKFSGSRYHLMCNAISFAPEMLEHANPAADIRPKAELTATNKAMAVV